MPYATATDPLQRLGSLVVPEVVPTATTQAWGCGDGAAGGAPGSAVPGALPQPVITGLPSLFSNPASNEEERWFP